jgi:hypothetical protein
MEIFSTKNFLKKQFPTHLEAQAHQGLSLPEEGKPFLD